MNGKTFGYLTVIKEGERNKRAQARWECLCKCGKSVTVEGSRLRNGVTKSCGCYRKELIQNRAEDLTGMVFGRLKVLRKSDEIHRSGFYPWICQCECGTIKPVRASNLKSSSTVSCGCNNNEKRKMRKDNFTDLSGKVFGKLTVLREAPRNRKKDIQWACLCECGTKAVVGGGQLREGRTKSCGCLRHEQHNLGDDREKAILKKVYSGIIARRKHRNLKNDLTYEEFLSIIFKPCVYCGVIRSNYSRDITAGHLITDTVVTFNGIDRIDSTIGYTKDNCVPCCKTCNLAKGKMAKKEFLLWVKKTYDHMKMKGGMEIG